MSKVIVSTIEELKEVMGQLFSDRLTAFFQNYKVEQVLSKDVLPGQAAPPYVTKKEAARLLSCSPSTIDNYARAGILTRHYVGKAVRFDRQQVLGLAKRHTSTKQRI